MTELEILGFVAILMLTHKAVWDLGNDPESQPLGVMKELQEHEVPSSAALVWVWGRCMGTQRGSKGGYSAVCAWSPALLPWL